MRLERLRGYTGCQSFEAVATDNNYRWSKTGSHWRRHRSLDSARRSQAVWSDKTEEEIWIENLSAIVTVSDDGGSSGRLRDELQMLPPGDIRNCMIALSEDSTLLSRLFRYRFRGDGELGGHSFGNLFLAALTEVTGDFTEAVRLSSEVLASKGHIYPGNDQRRPAGGGTGRRNSRSWRNSDLRFESSDSPAATRT